MATVTEPARSGAGRTMSAMVLERYGSPVVRRALPVPEPGPGEVVVRIEAAALCGSDLHLQAGAFERPGGRFAGLVPPIVMGHQIAGELAAVGAEVDGLEPGTRCVVYANLFCGRCLACLAGRQNLCRTVAKRVGLEVPGGFAEYVAVPAVNAFAAPDLDPAELSVLPDAVATAYHAVVRRAAVEPGEVVVVLGIGAIGLYVTRIAALRGAHVVAADRAADERAERAREFGASAVLSGDAGPQLVPEILDAAGRPADAVIDVVGSGETLAAAVSLLRGGGRLVVIGLTGDRALPLDAASARELRIMGSLSSTPRDLVEVLALAERGAVEPLVAERFPLDQANEALGVLAGGDAVGRLVLVP
ncbi:MAG: zinc-binding dehydrogenase [Actinomycetota bacterium]